ncbi:potassium-transporting ATPase subunit KdpA [Diplocloster agilis]|uniref:Potassium-transporting ATPase potassium-binding subunit n=1 Tax=Diplocloster agilis TaxID=2850323 RepID=A0A949NE40_9FIRM|nr:MULTISPECIES: potassium-transporting ATPase subunit KdpA [Lachnospiraceae]MBU9735919.1 potassium-transporting ATPase subunit KdpA [Diplocloster agilis]MCU6732832.1 potassium-transporting ATPase subunit KdpA [Suonthocola fibrivorans]SCI64596.1 potassium-transporting ATPase subunit A [uncultured Clostridium sp.]
MSNVVIQCVLYLVILVALGIPLGKYMGKVMNGEKVFLSKVLSPVEHGIYKLLHIDKDEDMTWKKYAVCTVVFSVIGFIFLLVMCLGQGILPLNPEKFGGQSWHLAFNTTSSFVTNTNWQAYSAENPSGGLSYFTQMLGLNVQNFVSAATGIAVLFALIRGFLRVKKKGLGNFYTDMTKIVLYILLPICLISAVVLVSQGVPQTFREYEEVDLLEPVTLEDGTVVTKEVIPLGPAASQIAIKQAGTNGGGFWGVNSAHPFENPTPLSNMFEMILLLLIPVGLCFTFGRNIKDMRQGRAIFIAMFLMLVVALGIVAFNEQAGTPKLAQNGAVDIAAGADQAGGNMEGKETRFGIATSSAWAAFTTAASNGSVNSMHDSYTPIGGMIPMLLMMLGEVVFGGTGCGLYGMIGFAILTVFIAGLMVGRTPEYLGKKIEPFEMKMAVLVCLATPIGILIGSGLACLLPATADSLNNPGAHGLSEVLYAYSSAGGNNGSAFAGFNANTPFLNVSIGLVMLFVRFLPMLATLAIAGSLVQKKKVAVSAGTLPTHNAMFIFLLVFIVLLVGALSFFPALALGPIAEFFQMIA